DAAPANTSAGASSTGAVATTTSPTQAPDATTGGGTRVHADSRSSSTDSPVLAPSGHSPVAGLADFFAPGATRGQTGDEPAAAPRSVPAPFAPPTGGGGPGGGLNPVTFFFALLLALAAAFYLAAQGVGRRLRLAPAPMRAPLYVSLLERPG
ncbi:MAG TPA: hypothetical protein VFG66_15480, partial [Gemmatimonadales bacterium]|nr:hypothetical protein [Gemmatimonadales bacterium]